MQFQVKKTQITQLDGIGIIMNAANPRLLHGGGLCGAIYDAVQRTGKDNYRQLMNQIDQIPWISPMAKLNYGDVVVTSAPGLKAKYICHALGPMQSRHNVQQQKQLVYQCYQKLFNFAQKTNQSIAIALISTGFYGCDKKIVTDTLKQVLRDYKTLPINITLCVIEDEDLQFFKDFKL